MRIKVQSDVDVRMSHDILQAFGIHVFACKPCAERVTQHMRGDFRQLLCMRPVVPLYRTPQYSLIVVSQIWFTTLAHKQEAAVPVRRVRFGLAAPCDHSLQRFACFFTHRHFADTALAFRRVDIEPFICLPQELMVDIDHTVRKVDIIHCQPAELGNAQPCFQQDKDFIIIPAVDRTALQEL